MRALRRRRRWTQRHLAEAAEVSRSVVGRIEGGQVHRVAAPTLIRVAGSPWGDGQRPHPLARRGTRSTARRRARGPRRANTRPPQVLVLGLRDRGVVQHRGRAGLDRHPRIPCPDRDVARDRSQVRRSRHAGDAARDRPKGTTRTEDRRRPKLEGRDGRPSAGPARRPNGPSAGPSGTRRPSHWRCRHGRSPSSDGFKPRPARCRGSCSCQMTARRSLVTALRARPTTATLRTDAGARLPLTDASGEGRLSRSRRRTPVWWTSVRSGPRATARSGRRSVARRHRASHGRGPRIASVSRGRRSRRPRRTSRTRR